MTAPDALAGVWPLDGYDMVTVRNHLCGESSNRDVGLGSKLTFVRKTLAASSEEPGAASSEQHGFAGVEFNFKLPSERAPRAAHLCGWLNPSGSQRRSELGACAAGNFREQIPHWSL